MQLVLWDFCYDNDFHFSERVFFFKASFLPTYMSNALIEIQIKSLKSG